MGGGLRVLGRARRRSEGSARLRVARLLWDTSPLWAVVLVGYVVVSAVLPVGILAAMGQVVGHIPGAARSGLGSHAGHDLVAALVVSVVAYALALALGPLQTMLSSALKVRLTYAMQDRLVEAVSRPTGIAHLEDSVVLDELELAHGKLTTYYPADAPMSLATVIGARGSGLLACAVLATYRWWLGIGMLTLWLLVRKPLRAVISEQAQVFGRTASLMRRARYLQQLAVKPAVAKESRIFGFGDWLVEEMHQQWTIAMSAAWGMLRRYNIGVTKLGVVVFAGYAGAITVLAVGAYHHELSLTALSTYLPMLVASAEVGDISWTDVGLEWQLISLPNLETLESRLGVVARRLSPVTELPTGRAEETAASTTPAGARAGRTLAGRAWGREVVFERVGFSYPGAPSAVFTDLSLSLRTGQSTALVGYNGAGKTTLVKLLVRLHDPTSGRISLDGADIAGLDASTWQREVAVVFQDFVRYPFSLAENIGVGAVEHLGDRDAVAEAAARAGIAGLARTLPHGWDTKLSPQYAGGVDLSGGQWQRVVLARALMAVSHGARMLVLDEPTAWLDSKGEAEFLANFLSLTSGLTTLVISHRFSTVRQADRICVLENGRVTETGSHDDLLHAGGRYAEMFTAQAAQFERAGEEGSP